MGASQQIQAASKQAARGRVYSRVCPVVFALWDTVDAITDFQEVCEQTAI